MSFSSLPPHLFSQLSFCLSPTLTLPSRPQPIPTYSLPLPPTLSLSTYTRSLLTLPIYLYPLPLSPLRPQPILSPPPSTLTLPNYTHSLLPLPILSPLLLRTKGMRGTLPSLMGKRGGVGDSHIPLPPRGE